MQILSITITTIRSPKINKQLVAMKACEPCGRASRQSLQLVGQAGGSLHGLLSSWVWPCCHQLTQHSSFESVLWISPKHSHFQPLFHSHTKVIHPFIPSFPLYLSLRSGKIWRWFLCQSPAKDMEESFVFVNSKIKDRIKKRPGMRLFAVWLMHWTLLC